MNVFQPVTLEWNGRQYVIAADRIMRALAIVENHITLLELQRAALNGSAPLAKISSAFADVINYAGGSVRAEDVYAGMFGDSADVERVQLAVVTLLQMMVPPDAARQIRSGAVDEAKKSKAAANSSKQLSKRRTRGASSRPNSGG